MPYWDERVEAMAKNYPGVKWDKYHIDIPGSAFVAASGLVRRGGSFESVWRHSFGFGSACTGTIGIAPSGSINPDGKFPSLFEPVHGSAPDIAGKGIANPVGQIWSAAMMLDHLGEPEAGKAIVSAIEQVLAQEKLRTGDLGGTANTVTCGKEVARALA